MSSGNPFSPPNVVEAELAAHQDAFQYNYMHNFKFLFTSPNWLMNWASVTLVLLIPILWPIILIGYQYEIIGALIYHRSGRYPDFDFGKFGSYLGRGLWPFLVSFVVGLCAMPVIFGLLLLQTVLISILGQQGNDGILIVSTFLLYLVMLVVSIAMNLLVIPFQLRAGLAQDFGSAFHLSFVKDFVRRTWMELVLGLLFIVILSPFLAIGGLLVFCIGYLFALSLLTLAFGFHIYQIYRLYLSRGGEMVPFKP